MEQLQHPAGRQRLERQAPRFLNAAQQQRYIEWVQDQAQHKHSWGDVRDAALRLIYLACGITVEESRCLLITDVQPDDVPHPQVRVRATSVVRDRSIELPAWSVPALRRWCQVNTELMLQPALAFPARVRSPVLARSGSRPRHEPMSTSEIYDTIQPAMQAAGFADEQQGPQTLRNTYAVQQLACGCTPEILRQRLGLHTRWSIDTLRRQAGLPISPDAV